ncbi:MAG: RNA-binding protein [Pseudomonadota bacterium]
MPHRKQNDDVAFISETGEPVRQCAVMRERRPQSEMVRFARSPDGIAVPDLAAKLPGRGVWVTAHRDAIRDAVEKRVFSRGFKMETGADGTLDDQVENLLVKRLQSTLGLAKKAGEIILGFDQVKAKLEKSRPGVLIAASDSSSDGRNKLYFLAKAIYEDIELAGALASAELGMAFGRSHVVHALLEAGAFSRNWQTDYVRLIGFRPAPEVEWYSATRQKQ